MRDFKGMKRQRGRNRSGGGKPQQHNANRNFDSTGPENIKVRGAAQSVFEKYQQLARDASSSGDRVLAENYLQHAEHYFRVLRAVQPNRPVSDFLNRDQFASGFDIDFEAEPEEAPETPAVEADSQADNEAEGQERPRRDDRGDRQNRYENRDRNNNDRGDRQDRDGGRRDRWRDRDENRDGGQPREGRPDREPRQDRDQPRQDREERGEREPREGRRDRFERRDREPRQEREPRQDREPRDPLAVVEPQAASSFAGPAEPAAPSHVLRGEGGDVSHAPAFLGRSSAGAPEAAADDAEPAKKPRRRRAPRSFEGGEGADAPPQTEEA